MTDVEENKSIEKINQKEARWARKEERRERRRNRTSSGSGIWGGLLVFIGLIFLGIYSGLVSPYIWSYIGQFWPILLILVGIQVIIGHGFIQRLAMTILAVVVFSLVLLNALYQTNSPLIEIWHLNNLPWFSYIIRFFPLQPLIQNYE